MFKKTIILTLLCSVIATNAIKIKFTTVYGANRAMPEEPWLSPIKRKKVVAICNHMLELAKAGDTQSPKTLRNIVAFHALALRIKTSLFTYNDSQNAELAGHVASQLYLMKLALANPLTDQKLYFREKP